MAGQRSGCLRASGREPSALVEETLGFFLFGAPQSWGERRRGRFYIGRLAGIGTRRPK